MNRNGVDVSQETSSAAGFVDLEPAPLTLAPITIPDVIIDRSDHGRPASGTAR